MTMTQEEAEAKAQTIIEEYITDTPHGYVIDFYAAIGGVAEALIEASKAKVSEGKQVLVFPGDTQD